MISRIIGSPNKGASCISCMPTLRRPESLLSWNSASSVFLPCWFRDEPIHAGYPFDTVPLEINIPGRLQQRSVPCRLPFSNRLDDDGVVYALKAEKKLPQDRVESGSPFSIERPMKYLPNIVAPRLWVQVRTLHSKFKH